MHTKKHSNLFQSTIQLHPDITKEYILNFLSQEEIMEYYLHVPVQYKFLFRSPLRIDNKPTCCFSWENGKLWFRDWSMDAPLDIFNIVMEHYSCSFPEAVKHIAEDLGLKNKELPKTISITHKKIEIEKKLRTSEKSKIRVKLQSFTNIDSEYLKSYSIRKSTARKFNVFSPKIVWLNGNIIYVYDKNNPALAYYFGKDKSGNEKWKIYFYTKRGEFRFLGNTSRINGWIQIPTNGDLLIITKSLKDVMSMYEFGLNAISMQGESTIPYDYIIKNLRERFNNIIVLYDHDETGIRNAYKIHELYNIPYVFLTKDSLGIEHNKAKDFSDYVKLNDKQKVIELVKSIRSKINKK